MGAVDEDVHSDDDNDDGDDEWDLFDPHRMRAFIWLVIAAVLVLLQVVVGGLIEHRFALDSN